MIITPKEANIILNSDEDYPLVKDEEGRIEYTKRNFADVYVVNRAEIVEKQEGYDEDIEELKKTILRKIKEDWEPGKRGNQEALKYINNDMMQDEKFRSDIINVMKPLYSEIGNPEFALELAMENPADFTQLNLYSFGLEDYVREKTLEGKATQISEQETRKEEQANEISELEEQLEELGKTGENREDKED